MIRRFLTLLGFAVLLTACGGQSASNSGTPFDQAQGKSAPVILTSTTFLADMTRNITGDRVRVESLLPVGTDPHEYQPVPSDVQKIAKSTVLIVNGLEYDQFIQPLLNNAGGTRLVITASDGLEARQMKEENGKMVIDPHMWMDPTRIIKYGENIREGLAKADPDGADVYKTNADVYISQLKEVDA